jgi:hypothetical protein
MTISQYARCLEQRLRSTDLRERLDATQEETTNAQGHGLQRWQQGYNEQKVMREWVWINACLSDELALYAAGRSSRVIARVAILAATRTNEHSAPRPFG